MTFRRRRNRRHGTSLIEMLVVISVWSVVIGILAVLLGQLLRAGNVARAAVEQQVALARLQRQFASDVRQAASHEGPDDEGKKLVRLVFDENHSASYVLGERDLLRLERRGGEVVSREAFRLEELVQVSVDRVGLGASLLQMKVTRADADPSAESRPLALFAAPRGGDHRFKPAAAAEVNP
jgi:type II secretory pathway pseudopilin PulG